MREGGSTIAGGHRHIPRKVPGRKRRCVDRSAMHSAGTGHAVLVQCRGTLQQLRAGLVGADHPCGPAYVGGANVSAGVVRGDEQPMTSTSDPTGGTVQMVRTQPWVGVNIY